MKLTVEITVNENLRLKLIEHLESMANGKPDAKYTQELQEARTVTPEEWSPALKSELAYLLLVSAGFDWVQGETAGEWSGGYQLTDR